MKKCFIFFGILIIAVIIAAKTENSENSIKGVEIAMEQLPMNTAITSEEHQVTDEKFK